MPTVSACFSTEAMLLRERLNTRCGTTKAGRKVDLVAKRSAPAALVTASNPALTDAMSRVADSSQGADSSQALTTDILCSDPLFRPGYGHFRKVSARWFRYRR